MEGVDLVPLYKKGDKQTVVIMEAYQFCQLHTKFYPTSCHQGELRLQRKLSGIICVHFNGTAELLIIYSELVKYLKKSGNTMKQCFSYL